MRIDACLCPEMLGMFGESNVAGGNVFRASQIKVTLACYDRVNTLWEGCFLNDEALSPKLVVPVSQY